jgi:hypothetical protein
VKEHTAREPEGREWSRSRVALPNAVAWTSGPITVLSSLAMAELPDGSGELGPQWQISISHQGKRPKPHHVRRALRAFGMVGAEEDNHHPGNARHFWLPVDPKRRRDCECKETEETVVDADGYTWTNPRVGDGECRGCELERLLRKPCPIHAAA